MSEQYEEPRSSREWVKFGILAVILIILPVSCLAARPLVFGKIVPAVMGEGIELPTRSAPASIEEPMITPEEPDEAGEPSGEKVLDGPVEEMAEETEMAYPGPHDPPDQTAAGTTPEVVTHTIRQGENLQTIAAQYSVTVQALIAANRLANPNYIRIGDTLVIPQKEE